MIRRRALRDHITIFLLTFDGSGSGDAARYGDPVPVEGEGVTVPASVRPFREREVESNQDRRVSMVKVIVNADVIVDGVSRVEWNGRSWEVFGEPETWAARNGPHHRTFTMRSEEGI